MSGCKTRVALLATVVGYGGAEKVVLTLIDKIDPERFELVPIIFTRPDQQDNIFFERLEKTRTRYHKVYADKHRIKYMNPVANVLDAYRLVKKSKCDLIHTHGYRADVIGKIAAWLTSTPILSTCHGFISIDSNLSLYNRVDRFLLRRFNMVMAVSNGIKDELVRSGVKGSMVEVVPNAVDSGPVNAGGGGETRAARRDFGIGEDEFVIGFVGRLSEEKGVAYLVEAASGIKEAGVPLKLMIIGEGPERRTLESLVEKLGLSEEVLFAGFRSDVDECLKLMDLFILPSLTEGTPVSVLEAMASGVPVMATSVGGLPCLVDSGRNGILVEPGNSDALRDAALKLFNDRSAGKGLAEEARKTVESNYGTRQWIERVEAAYMKVSRSNRGDEQCS